MPPRNSSRASPVGSLRIGAGAGFSGDRIEPALELAEKGQLDYLVFECLAERTIALAHERRLADPEGGYDTLLDARMEAVLTPCVEKSTRIISNMGAANPQSAARRVAEIARRKGHKGLRIAAVLGDDVFGHIDPECCEIIEQAETIPSIGERLISANAYLGVAGIVDALAAGADVVITGRVSDPSLFLAPLVYEFGWKMDDWDRLAQGTLVGHLLECAGQLTGGYFADPGIKDVPDLGRLGFPFAEVEPDGSATVSKVPGSGGRLTLATCKEQLVYEILDPSHYVQPDVVADFTHVMLREIGPDRISVSGAKGLPRPDRLKLSLGYRDSFVGEGQISYAGPGANARARLALQLVAERFRLTGLPITETRYELIGVDSVNPGTTDTDASPPEIRVRVVGRADTMAAAIAVGNEVETLYTNGPGGGGGVTKSAREVIAVVSTLIDRNLATPSFTMEIA